jgi:hypothetical protein
MLELRKKRAIKGGVRRTILCILAQKTPFSGRAGQGGFMPAEFRTFQDIEVARTMLDQTTA